MYRQGDVNLIPVRRLPNTAQPWPAVNARVTLREGEATGHGHSLPADVATLYVDDNGQHFVEVVAECMLQHLTDAGTPTREHDPISIPVGIYLLPEQVEYTPERLRRVAD